MWLLRGIMWLHERNGWDTRAEERAQQSHRARRSGRADHDHPPRQAGGEDRLHDEIASDGGTDSEWNGEAGEASSMAPTETREAARPRQDGSRIRLRGPSLSVYLDTSAVIKLLVDEPGSELIDEVFERSANASTSVLTYVEATSALARMRKGGRLSAARHRSALRDLDELWSELDLSSVTDDLVESASQAANHHALRAYDSVHLATALTFAEVEDVTFACWDRELRDAAGDHGFALVPVQI